MSVLAACAHKSEWVCRSCAKCSSCCTCETFDSVHIGTKAAADALARYARLQRKREEAFVKGKQIRDDLTEDLAAGPDIDL